MLTLTKFPGEGDGFRNGPYGFLIVAINHPTPGLFYQAGGIDYV